MNCKFDLKQYLNLFLLPKRNPRHRKKTVNCRAVIFPRRGLKVLGGSDKFDILQERSESKNINLAKNNLQFR